MKKKLSIYQLFQLKIKLKSLNKTIIFSSDFTNWDLNSDYWIDFNVESVDFL